MPAPTAAQAAEAAVSPSSSTKKISRKSAEKAEDAYIEGARQLRDANYDAAEKSFLRAIKLDPQKSEYILALSASRERHLTGLLQQSSQARMANRPEEAEHLLAQARAIDPSHPLIAEHTIVPPSALPHVDQVAQRHFILASTIEFAPTKDLHSFHERGDVRIVLQHVLTAYGIKPTFESDVPAKNIRLDVDDIDFTSALTITQMMTSVFYTPLDANTAIVAKDNPENRERLERLVEEMIPLSGYTIEEINDVANLVRNVFNVKQVIVQPSQSSLILRAPAETINSVNRIVEDLVTSSNEVLIDLKLYSIDTSRSRTTGLTPPQSLTAYSAAGEAQNLVNNNQSAIQQLIAAGLIPANASVLTQALALLASGLASSTLFTNSFLKFGGGISTGLLSAGNNPSLALGLSSSDTRNLDEVQLRVGERQTATFRSGSRYPITTSLYSGIANVPANLSGLLPGGITNTVIPQIQYEDLGITVKATPRVQRGQDVFLHIEFKISALSGTGLNGIPILASRQFTNDVTVADGSTALLVSQVSKTEAASIGGLPGLSQLPGFQSVTGRDSELSSSTLLLMLTPHLVRKSRLTLAGPYVPLAPRAGAPD